MLKFAVFALLVAVARAGVLDYSHGYAAPVVAKIAAPAASSHASFTQHTVSHAAPVAHYAAAPVAHYAAAPVAHYAAAPVAHYATPVVAKTLVAAPVHKTVVAEHYAPPHYDFEYAVHDPHTGDVKEQKESRKDDVVHGVYSLVEPDGTRRVVEYTADDHNGFNAVVHREPAQHPVAVKAVAPVVKYAAPALSYGHAAPALAYAAPAAHHVTHHY